jgi:hypothetical protein
VSRCRRWQKSLARSRSSRNVFCGFASWWTSRRLKIS